MLYKMHDQVCVKKLQKYLLEKEGNMYLGVSNIFLLIPFLIGIGAATYVTYLIFVYVCVKINKMLQKHFKINLCYMSELQLI